VTLTYSVDEENTANSLLSFSGIPEHLILEASQHPLWVIALVCSGLAMELQVRVDPDSLELRLRSDSSPSMYGLLKLTSLQNSGRIEIETTIDTNICAAAHDHLFRWHRFSAGC
jgi:hypothetical protein